jgi:hypothetical protein
MTRRGLGVRCGRGLHTTAGGGTASLFPQRLYGLTQLDAIPWGILP